MRSDGDVTVACGAGFAGDRVEPAVEFARAGGIDAVVLECLAERTLIGALLERAADPQAGFDHRWRRRLSPLLPAARASGCRVVSNLGSANPRAAAAAVADLGAELGLQGLKVAAVVGDDIADRADAVTWADDAGRDAASSGDTASGVHGPDVDWLGVHAYLGAAPIAAALDDGADVVICGRSADSALFAAPALARHGVDLEQASAAVAGATAVGHILECGGQLTGGNLADMVTPLLSGSDYARLGYPMARVARDGTAELSVLPGAPARLDAIGATLQLFYEVHDPAAYLTPDVTLDLTGVRFEPIGENRLRMSGALGRPRPDRLKAVGFGQRPGVISDVEITYAGDGACDRARLAADTLRERIAVLGVERFAVDLVGVDSVLGAASIPASAPPAELRVHVSAVCASAELAQAVEDELYALTVSGPPGGCALRSERRPHLQVASGLIDRDRVTASVEWFVS